jgi:hypothetical protein
MAAVIFCVAVAPTMHLARYWYVASDTAVARYIAQHEQISDQVAPLNLVLRSELQYYWPNRVSTLTLWPDFPQSYLKESDLDISTSWSHAAATVWFVYQPNVTRSALQQTHEIETQFVRHGYVVGPLLKFGIIDLVRFHR